MIKKLITYGLIMLVLTCIPGCRAGQLPVYEKNGKIYGKPNGFFRDRWYDYYESGISLMEGEFYAEALAVLEEAARRRPDDRRMARTYGMHFLDYFPHREMGVIYFLEGDYDAALMKLNRSIRDEPTAKARYYLDKTREQIMIRENRPVSRPELGIRVRDGLRADGVAETVRTRHDPVILECTARDPQYVSEIMVDGKPVRLESSEQQVSFSRPLDLIQGKHEIEMSVRNLMKGITVKRILIHVDRAGPVIVLAIRDSDTVVRGAVHDESGIAFFLADGMPVPMSERPAGGFVFELKAGPGRTTLEAEDNLGNRTRAVLDPDDYVAGNRLLVAEYRPFAIMTDAADAPKSPLRPEPGIIAEGWPEKTTVYTDRVQIHGQVSSSWDIHSVRLNGVTIVPDAWRSGNRVFFSHGVRLEEGENIICLQAWDISGNGVEKRFTIVRSIPAVFHLKHRYGIAVHPFDNSDPVNEDGFFGYSFIKQVIERRRFRVRIREEFNEHGLFRQLNPLMPADSGQLPFHATVLGIQYRTRQGLEVAVRVVDNRTSEILSVHDVFGKPATMEDLERMAHVLAEKIHAAYPLAGGVIHGNDGEQPVAGISDHNVTPGWPALVYRDAAPVMNPVTGEDLGADTVVLCNAAFSGPAAGDSENTGYVINTECGDGGFRMGDKVLTR